MVPLKQHYIKVKLVKVVWLLITNSYKLHTHANNNTGFE